jgi:hypothetical protein
MKKGKTMTDDNRKITAEQMEDVAEQLLDSYSKLVGMTAQRIADGDAPGEKLEEDLAGLTESQVRSMLQCRIVADAVQCQEIIEKLNDKPLENMGDDPVLH